MPDENNIRNSEGAPPDADTIESAAENIPASAIEIEGTPAAETATADAQRDWRAEDFSEYESVLCVAGIAHRKQTAKSLNTLDALADDNSQLDG